MCVLHIQELEIEVNCFWRELPPEGEEAEGKGKSEWTNRCSSSVPSPPENLLSLAHLAYCLPLLWAAPNDPGALAALRGKPGVR
ncbi:unnamed protein product [Schistocephalus solidus]|uniref:Small integral membrane protein 28 n=1 Tax=Schistocephalus solidus TaxID=70667 RepID=A0A183TTY5_SCHSO|nr:unnamed protein product [Schistocephalus solidus]